jgi:hypothetical protein
MNKYTFFATIRPEHAVLNHLNLFFTLSHPFLEIKGGDLNFRLQANTLCYKSNLLIEVIDLNRYFNFLDFTSLIELRNCILETIAFPIVDSLNYLYGNGFTTDIMSVMLPNGEQLTFDVSVTLLCATQSQRPFAEIGGIKQFEKVFKIVCQSPHLIVALGDLRQAIIMQSHTPLFCFRAIESIRRTFGSGKESNDKNEWDKFRNELVLDLTSLDVLTRLSEQNRHAGMLYLSGESRQLLLSFTWRIVDRYCLYLEGGCQTLKTKFKPLLLEAPIEEYFELPKIKEEISRYSDKYPDKFKTYNQIRTKGLTNIDNFLESIRIQSEFKKQYKNELDKKNTSERQELKKQLRISKREIERMRGKRQGASVLLQKILESTDLEKDDTTCIKEDLKKIMNLLSEE